MRRHGKKLLLLSCVLALLLLAGCAGGKKAQPLPEGMDRSALLTAGEEVVELLAARDYEAVYGRFREDVREAVTAEDVAATAGPTLDSAGTFEEITEAAASGDDQDEPLGVTEFLCRFSEKKVRFQVVFDPELELTGFVLWAEDSGWSLSNLWSNVKGFFS